MFELGRTLATPGALAALEQAGESPELYLSRHHSCDWGELTDEDKRLNDDALKDGSRILSAYRTKIGVRLWIITEAVSDQGRRAATTILLPDEY
jgi:hypothetical protein